MCRGRRLTKNGGWDILIIRKIISINNIPSIKQLRVEWCTKEEGSICYSDGCKESGGRLVW